MQKKVAEGVWFIEGRDDMIPDSHMYVLGDPSTGDLTLVDAGLMGKGRYKMDSLAGLGLDPAHVKRVIMTHTHLDHIGCLPELLGEIPGVELWVHTAEAGPLEQGDDRCVYGMSMFKSMCESQYRIGPGMFTFTVHRKLEGGETVHLGGMAWEVLHIPGHSPGSIGLYNPSGKILIPGDVVYADNAIGRFDLHGASGAQHRESLLTLAELSVDILLPGHNRIMEKVPRGYIEATARQWGPYLR